MPQSSPTCLSAAERSALLAYSRAVASCALGVPGAERPVPPVITNRFGGAFVTFYRGKALRGCIGSFLPTTDLARTIEHVTRSSLTDPRFTSDPITLDELPELTMEISILSDPISTHVPASLIPGTHGIIVRQGARSGCFLPKVASERGWNAEEFLSSCCTMKAGLPADAWRRSSTTVLLFTADAFAETEKP